MISSGIAVVAWVEIQLDSRFGLSVVFFKSSSFKTHVHSGLFMNHYNRFQTFNFDLLKFSCCFTMSSHNSSSSTSVTGRDGPFFLKRFFVIALTLSTAPPPPASINKGPFSIPLDPKPTRARFSDLDVHALANENKKFILVGKIFGDPISRPNHSVCV